ncbi:MAG TPA: HD domain-containing protein [Thermomicrobiales bacterium]|nr:HD domain-containing protein [Thermomicrobiales bacterium]
MSELSRDEAWALVTEYIQSESLRRHCLSVETAMRAYAAKNGESVENWGAVGLIHDFDYEIHPTLDQHPQDGAPILRQRGYPDWAIDAVLSHADHLDIPRDTDMKKTLYAVDELTGFISAVAFVRPTKAVADVTPKAVRKKMKDKAFARAVDREAMLHGAELLGVDFDEHVAFVVLAMTDNAEILGLAGVPVDADAR